MLKRLFPIFIVLIISACSDTPDATPLPPTETSVPAPILLSPAQEQMVGYHVPILLEWSWEQPLAENQVYSVHMARAGEPLQDVQWTGETLYDIRWFAQEGGDYDWQILVLQLADGAYEKTVTASPVQRFTVPETPEALIQTFPVPETQNFPNDCSIIPLTTTENAYLGIAASYHGLTAEGVYMYN
ncbi:MAG: hypothetical protein K8I82_25435, partial [Anaerolineae bacterium]|nr:hypothetical protein [Anaerolineae bacterium]